MRTKNYGILLVALLFGEHAQAAGSAEKPLNVLLIVTDDMNNHLGCYGHPMVQTPHIDHLAHRGMRFDSAYCQVAVCNPSRVSFLSGLRPDRTQVYTLTEKTRSHLGDWLMLPEYFRRHGYYTAQVGKIYHTDDGYEDPRSWDLEIREFGKRPEPSEILRGGEPNGPGGHTIDWEWLRTPDEKTPDGIVARRAAQVMEDAVKQGKPFFLGAGFRRPHAPFAAPQKYFDLYPLDEVPLPPPVPQGYYADLPAAAINYPAPDKPMTELQQRELVAAYYACNSFVDAQIGVLWETLDRLKLWDNTIVVFFGDHGYHLGDHGGLWHKMSLFEESARVPFIVYAPGMKGAGKPSTELVELIDVYPTLVKACGLPPREDLDGVDLAPLLDDPQHAIKEGAYTVTSRSNDPAADHAKTASYLGRTIRTRRWRYTEWDDGKKGLELYDHDDDPQELSNLAGSPEYDQVREELRELLWQVRPEKGKRYGQFAPPEAFENGSALAYYGSENEWNRRQFTFDRAQSQPKRWGQMLLLATLDGNPQRTVDLCRAQLTQGQGPAKEETIQETLFTLCCAYCRQQELDQAWETFKQALEAGVPIERFIAGPRELLQPLTSTPRFQALLAEHSAALLHGPLLGAMTDRSVRVWTRCAGESKVTLRVFASADAQEPLAVAEGAADASRDFTSVVEIANLQPNTRYWYDALIDGRSVQGSERQAFRTFPSPGKPAKFRVAFGGGAGYNPSHERMWNTIAAESPDALLLLGDNVYIDMPQAPGAFHRYTYYRRQSRPEFRQLARSVPTFAIWDDHDCATDDAWMGPYLDKPVWKRALLELFRENWNNPTYGTAECPGCFFRFAIGDVEFFMLDCRFYRTNPFGEQPTMLGPVQQAWLHDQLLGSTARIKVLASSVPWSPGAKPGSRDTWDGFAAERDEILGWIAEQDVRGVVLMAADRHRSDAWKIDRPGGGSLYEVMSSRLTNVHTHECLPGALVCYNEKCSFGTLDFDTRRADPTVTYRIVNIDGEQMATMTLTP